MYSTYIIARHSPVPSLHSQLLRGKKLGVETGNEAKLVIAVIIDSSIVNKHHFLRGCSG